MADTHLDVLIVGAGLSGVGAACHLVRECPGKSFAILEARDALGGTWDLFRYPGVRSDSDMFTLGYSFRPWREAKAIADGPSILRYVQETAQEYGVDDAIRYGHRVLRAAWSSDQARWTVTAEHGGEEVTLTCSFLYGAAGYYRYDDGYTPEFPGRERFTGDVVHPQFWPAELDWSGRRVVVIGSGATAVTLVPELARDAAHVVMLQRSPTYVLSLPAEDRVANLARRVLPARVAHSLIRTKNVVASLAFFQLSRRRPELVKALLRRGLERALPKGYDISAHFTPAYEPWDQRMCFVPDEDLFEALSAGRATVVTDHVDSFTETGIRLRSGTDLEADVIVTATGLNILPMGGLTLAVDGEAVEVPEKVAYKGMMLEDVPNLAFAAGYTNASWTLKCDLTAAYMCRLLRHMDATGRNVCTPRNRDPALETEPLIDFTSGYVQRGIASFPKQGTRTPWRSHMNYLLDLAALRFKRLEDGVLEFERMRPREGTLSPAGR